MNENDNERMLKAIEGKKQFKQCISCERKFIKGTICPWCKNGWVYAYEDDEGHITFGSQKFRKKIR
jgi:hypothetical protein